MNVNYNPLVSIIIPVYNGSNYMREAIESALNQTYKNIEVIVVNDGSNDNGKTEKIALQYGDKIRYIRKENGGVSSALNLGIENMKGEFFSWLSHDDVYVPEKVEKQIELLKKYNTETAVIKSFTRFIDKSSSPINNKEKKTYEKVLEWEEAVSYITQYGANGCTLLINKKILNDAGQFDENLRYCQDTFMWWKIFLNKVPMIMCDHIGVNSRIHGMQLTRTGKSLFHKDSLYISNILIPEFEKNNNNANRLLFKYAKQQAIYGNNEVVKKCIIASKHKKCFSYKDVVVLRIYSIYGIVRPLIRKIYYKVVHKIKMS